MNADSAYVIGKSHEVCQDYARAGIESSESRHLAYAIVCDGCSSSTDSDIGARLLALSTEKFLKHETMKTVKDLYVNIDEFGDIVLQEAIKLSKDLSLSSESLDATLLMAVADHHDVMLAAFGDGAMVVVRLGSTQVIEVEFPDGFPCYLSYRMDDSRREKYNKLSKPGIISETVWCVGGGEASKSELSKHKVHAMIMPVSSVSIAAIMSDGVGSFRKPNENGGINPISVDNVLKDLMDFKLLNGRFVRRRVNAFLKKVAREGWEHYDDFSFAAIHMEVGK